MSTKVVTSTASLLSALKTAHTGDTILLGSGTYSAVNIAGMNFAGVGVTIASLDSNKPAIITDMSINKSSGINVSDVEMTVATTITNPFAVNSSSNIHFSDLNVHGTLNGTPADDNSAFNIRNSSNVSIVNSEFHDLWLGIGHLDDNGLVFSGNYFHDIRTDGIRGGGSSNVVVSDNYFTNFYPIAGDHPDAIQFWTKNTTTSASNITVENNVVVRGDGAGIQGVFFRDQTEVTPYQNVKVLNNLVVGAGYNGISIGGVDHLEVSGNSVVAFDDQKSWIRIATSDDVVVKNNDSSIFAYDQLTHASTSTNNTVTDTSDTTGARELYDWAQAHKGELPDLPTAFQSVVSGLDVHTIAATEAAVATAAAIAAAKAAIITGDAGDNNLYGGAPNETLSGLGGDDNLYGKGGIDHLDGGAGNDTLEGGAGADFLTGGLGKDTFVYKPDAFSKDVAGSMDTITDFSAAQGDRIKLNAIDANVNTSADDAFKFIGSQAFHKVAGELRYEVFSDKVIVWGDTNGDGVADFGINLMGVSSLKAADFML